MFSKTRRAFTLIEIMIVVLIIGILLAIAVPNFVRARESSRAKACVANLKQVESAKEQWAMDNKKTGTDTPTLDSTAATGLVGATLYIKATPSCPAGGTYTVGNVATAPSCSYGSTVSYAPHTL
jgi:prepilin-type N-terminal cleavage/methylation domain-containing protein